MKLKNLIALNAITVTVFGSLVMGGVEVYAKDISAEEYSKRFDKYFEYSCGKRISIIRESIPSLKAKYKKSGKKYPTKNIPDSVVRELHTKYGLIGVTPVMKIGGKREEISIGNLVGIGTLRYLRRCHQYGELIKYYNINGGTFTKDEIADFKFYASDIVLRK